MGWWSPTILGGDSPMDTVYDVVQFTGISSEWDKFPEVTKHAFERLEVTQWMKFISSRSEPGIAAQVVALMHMAVGATLSDSIKKLAIEACNNERCDSWSNPSERKANLNEFVSMLNAYKGVPIRPKEECLWDKLAVHLSQNKHGLINDNV